MNGNATGPVILYGAPASLYTAKVRACLRARRLDYVERFPSDPHYREIVRPQINSHRIPVVEFQDGLCVQDSTVILDEIERRWPDPRASRLGPQQRWLIHLMELIAERALAKPAMHFRWSYPEANQTFLVGEFGRSLRFPGPKEEIERLGLRVAEKMAAYLPQLGVTPDTIPSIVSAYETTLRLLEQHFATHAFLLGGGPTRADYALMGPLYGHLGRDPYPLQLMQRSAPLVFRWTERVNAAEAPGPEYANSSARLGDVPVAESLVAWLRHVLLGFAPELIASVEQLGVWIEAHPELGPGENLHPTEDQPSLGEIVFDYYGVSVRQQAQGHPLWLLQRLLDFTDSLLPNERGECQRLARDIGAESLLSLKLAVPLTRKNNRLAIATDPEVH